MDKGDSCSYNSVGDSDEDISTQNDSGIPKVGRASTGNNLLDLGTFTNSSNR